MHEPLYRPVLRDAFRTAWKQKRLWPVALGAGLLLSGSVYDVVWQLMNSVAPQATLPGFIAFFWSRATVSWSAVNVVDVVFGGIQVLQMSVLFLILAFAAVGLSVICQGALVFLLGKGGNGRARVREALTVGARAFWPLFVLNLLSLSLLLAVRSLLAICVSMAATAGTVPYMLLYFVAFVVFVLLSTSAVVIQIFAMNAMILQGATLAQAIQRGARLLQRHWLISVETAFILLAIGLVSWAAVVVAAGVLAIPFFTVLFVAIGVGSGALFSTAFILAFLTFFGILIAIGGWIVTLQYSAWVSLYQRLGEGGAIPKVHRWLRTWVRNYRIPGA